MHARTHSRFSYNIQRIPDIFHRSHLHFEGTEPAMHAAVHAATQAEVLHKQTCAPELAVIKLDIIEFFERIYNEKQ